MNDGVSYSVAPTNRCYRTSILPLWLLLLLKLYFNMSSLYFHVPTHVFFFTPSPLQSVLCFFHSPFHNSMIPCYCIFRSQFKIFSFSFCPLSLNSLQSSLYNLHIVVNLPWIIYCASLADPLMYLFLTLSVLFTTMTRIKSTFPPHTFS